MIGNLLVFRPLKLYIASSQHCLHDLSALAPKFHYWLFHHVIHLHTNISIVEGNKSANTMQTDPEFCSLFELIRASRHLKLILLNCHIQNC